MAIQIDLARVVFEEFLKVSPDLISRYNTVQDQLLYLILIPHVLLLLFLLAFSKGIVKRFTGEHAKFRFLLGITAYIYIIWSGWYGTLFIPFFLGWFYIALGIAVFLFLISIVWHPAAGPAGGKLLTGVFQSIGEKTIGREKERETLEDEIKMVIDQIRTLETELRHPGITPMAASYAQMQIQQLKSQLVVFKRKLSKL